MWLFPVGFLALGILLTILIQNLRGDTDHAKRIKAEADIYELEVALDHFHDDRHAYPTTVQGLSELVSAPEMGQVPSNYRHGDYLQSVPKDPWGNRYFYRSDGKSYRLKSLGADGAEGGTGKNADVDASGR